MQRLFEILKKYDYLLVFLLLVALSLVMMVRTTYYQGSKLAQWGNSGRLLWPEG